jgi:hypothetical protein
MPFRTNTSLTAPAMFAASNPTIFAMSLRSSAGLNSFLVLFELFFVAFAAFVAFVALAVLLFAFFFVIEFPNFPRCANFIAKAKGAA